MGINKHIEEESYAYGSSTQILSPSETAIGTSAPDLASSLAKKGVMNPVLTGSTTASGVSSFNIPSSSGSMNSSCPLSSAIATGSSVSNLPNQSNAASFRYTIIFMLLPMLN